ncbi:protein mono-ADP-ribosyltransferase TIPARP-like isoform X2 [Stigmatopora nigra]
MHQQISPWKLVISGTNCTGMNNTLPPRSSQDAPQRAYQPSTQLVPTQLDVTWMAPPYLLHTHIAPKYPTDGTSATWSGARNSFASLPPPPPPPPSPNVAPVPAFYTWNADHVDICDNFLLGICLASDVCGMHHTPYPFFWQLYNTLTNSWVHVKPSAQLLLERIYSNVNLDTVRLVEGPITFTLSLNDMEIVDFHKYSSARRLSNSECPLKNPHFPDQWLIYWWNDMMWMEYDQEVSALLRAKMATKEMDCCFMVNSQEYKVDFTTMMQTNVTTGFVRDVRCRPVYRSLKSLHPHLKTGVQTAPSLAAFDPNFNMVPLGSTLSPPFWRVGLGADFGLMNVPVGSQVFMSVREFFFNTIPENEVDIVDIQQVQNFAHWEKYQRHKAYLEGKHAGSDVRVEYHLFHGTTLQAAKSICRNNFDPSLAGPNGRALGYATYFSSMASLSHSYAVKTTDGMRHMFLAKVLVGRITKGKPEYHLPPPHGSTFDFYDACVDCEFNPRIFAIFSSWQCYPSYLIRYRDLNGVVQL